MYDDNYEKLVGVDGYRELIDQWIKDRPTYALLITGPSGSGKTHFITEYLAHNNYKTIVYNSSTFKKQCKLRDILNKVYQNVNIMNTQTNTFKQAIIFDELEGIGMNDKGCIGEIINFIKMLIKYKVMLCKGKPVDQHFNLDIVMICIGQDSYIKKIKDLKRVCTQITFDVPQNEHISSILYKELPNITNSRHDDFIQSINGDFRKLKSILVTNECNTMDLKLYNLYDISNRILYHHDDIKTIIRHFNNQKILLPLMIHENYKASIFNKSTKVARHIANVSKIISDSDCICRYIFNFNEWDLGFYYVISSCYTTSKYIETRVEQTKSNHSSKSEWPMLLNRSSLRCTYKHTYDTYTSTFNDYYTDRSTVRFNLAKIKNLLQKNKEKYSYLLDVYNFDCVNDLDKVFKSI
jgi:DNA polymerase III delta prime subunit